MNNCNEEEKLKQRLFQICCEYLQGPWKNVSADDIELSEVKGGLSSSVCGLYLCALPDSLPEDNEDDSTNIPRKVIVRFLNMSAHSNDEIVQENVVFSILSEKNLGPKLCGVFPGGRLEEYIPNMEMNPYCIGLFVLGKMYWQNELADQLLWHGLTIDGIRIGVRLYKDERTWIRVSGLPLSEPDSCILDFLEHYGLILSTECETYAWNRKSQMTWNDIPELYINIAKELAKFHSIQMPIKKTPPKFDERTLQWITAYESASKERKMDIHEFVSGGEFRKELMWLLDKIHELNPKVVCCHNDLNGGNILLLNNSHNSSKKRIKFIDFELVGYNYRSMDIACYFAFNCLTYNPAEPTKLSADVNKYPTETEQREFVKAYVNQFYETRMELRKDKEKEVNDILKELEIMKLTPALYWISFKIEEAVKPRINIPMKDYIQVLSDMYKGFKEKIPKRN